jgi:3-phosphoshikimate 1-carboxyvinyltransferase
MILKVPATIDIKRLKAPASKSYAQRAILMAALAKGQSRVSRIGQSDDVQHILTVARSLGAAIEPVEEADVIMIKGFQSAVKSSWFVGESGLGARLAIPIAAVFSEEILINGKGSLLARPMTVHTQILPDFGVQILHHNLHLPIRVKGPLKGGEVYLDGSTSSQYLSGLLMALPLAQSDSKIVVKNFASRPYLDMTIDLLKRFDITINEKQNAFQIPGNQQYKSTNYVVEGDWSGAAFWAVYGAIHQSIQIEGLHERSLQADRAIIDVLTQVGATVEWQHQVLSVSPEKLHPFEFDAWHCPDLFPVLVVLGAAIKGVSIIHGVDRLKHKESDRGAVLMEEFAKLGLVIDITGSKMIVHGTGKLQSGVISSHNDHRIAMAGAIAALLTDEGVEIHGAEAVNKSYPGFWEEFQ